MNHDRRRIMNGYLDGTLSADEEAELNAWIKAAPENAAAFADLVRFHDRLRNVVQLKAAKEFVPQESARGIPRHDAATARRSWRPLRLMGGLVAAAAFDFIADWSSNAPQASAAAELDRLIETAADGGDRS